MARSEAGNVFSVVEITGAAVAAILFVYVVLPKLLSFTSSLTPGGVLSNAQNYRNNNGSAYTAAQAMSLIPQYDSAADTGSLPYQSAIGLPDSDYPLYDGGDEEDDPGSNTVADYSDPDEQVYIDGSGDGTGGANNDPGGF